MKRTILPGLGAAAILVSLYFAACSTSTSPASASATTLKPSSERKPAPSFALKDADGKTVRLSDYRGKVLLINFWATWCGPCKLEIPWFREFEQKHKDRGFAVLGISMDEGGWDAVKPFIEDLKVNYRILMGDESIAQMYGGVNSLPTSFLIDREGKIASVHVGLVSKNNYENEIEELLSTSSSSLPRAGVDAVAAVVVGAR